MFEHIRTCLNFGKGTHCKYVHWKYYHEKVVFLKYHKKMYFLKYFYTKAELPQEGIFFLIHFFAREVLGMKKFEIKKNKPTFIISVLKVEY